VTGQKTNRSTGQIVLSALGGKKMPALLIISLKAHAAFRQYLHLLFPSLCERRVRLALKIRKGRERDSETKVAPRPARE